MKKIFFAVLFLALSVQARSPFEFFLKSISIPPDTTYYGFTPGIVIPDLELIKRNGTAGFDVLAFTAIGAGIDFGQHVKSASGRVYETYGASLFLLTSTGKNTMVGGAVHVFNRLLGVGTGYDLNAGRVVWLVTSGVKLF